MTADTPRKFPPAPELNAEGLAAEQIARFLSRFRRRAHVHKWGPFRGTVDDGWWRCGCGAQQGRATLTITGYAQSRHGDGRERNE